MPQKVTTTTTTVVVRVHITSPFYQCSRGGIYLLIGFDAHKVSRIYKITYLMSIDKNNMQDGVRFDSK